MKLFLAALSSLAVVGAQSVQSKPFNLVVLSASDEFNGTALSACHTGAGIESLCLLSSGRANFTFNTTEGDQPGPAGVSGILTWTLPTRPPVPSAMTFSVDPSSNVALPLLVPGPDTAQPVSFDSSNLLSVTSYLDDTKSPPNGSDPHVLRNWYVCKTYYLAYTYTTLAWVLGVAAPQNPSCVKVDVLREFI